MPRKTYDFHFFFFLIFSHSVFFLFRSLVLFFSFLSFSFSLPYKFIPYQCGYIIGPMHVCVLCIYMYGVRVRQNDIMVSLCVSLSLSGLLFSFSGLSYNRLNLLATHTLYTHRPVWFNETLIKLTCRVSSYFLSIRMLFRYLFFLFFFLSR